MTRMIVLPLIGILVAMPMVAADPVDGLESAVPGFAAVPFLEIPGAHVEVEVPILDATYEQVRPWIHVPTPSIEAICDDIKLDPLCQIIKCEANNGHVTCEVGPFCDIPAYGESPLYIPDQGVGAAVGPPSGHDRYGPYVGVVVWTSC